MLDFHSHARKDSTWMWALLKSYSLDDIALMAHVLAGISPGRTLEPDPAAIAWRSRSSSSPGLRWSSGRSRRLLDHS
jgi:hypothetical protein